LVAAILHNVKLWDSLYNYNVNRLESNIWEINDPSSNYSYENECFWDILHNTTL